MLRVEAFELIVVRLTVEKLGRGTFEGGFGKVVVLVGDS